MSLALGLHFFLAILQHVLLFCKVGALSFSRDMPEHWLKKTKAHYVKVVTKPQNIIFIITKLRSIICQPQTYFFDAPL